MFTLFSLADVPIVRDFELDPRVLLGVSGADRIGALSSSAVLEVDALNALAEDDGDGAMDMIGALLRESISRRITLWLGVVDPRSLPHLRSFLGDAMAVAGPEVPVPDSWRLRLLSAETVVPVAVSPDRLLSHALAGSLEHARWAHTHLEGIDTKRISRANLARLRSGGVRVIERTSAFRLAHSPVFWAYTAVMVYSICRALPVTFVPNFHGSLWVLWGLDVCGAIPYTWGVIAMFAARRAVTRLVGLAVALITFAAPYVYFWAHGSDYPAFVNAIVTGFIVSAVGLEMWRWIRDRRVWAAAVDRPLVPCATHT